MPFMQSDVFRLKSSHFLRHYKISLAEKTIIPYFWLSPIYSRSTKLKQVWFCLWLISIFLANIATLFIAQWRIRYVWYMYIHERDNWTAFRWNTTELTALLEEVNRKQIHTGFVQRKVTSVRKDFTPWCGAIWKRWPHIRKPAGQVLLIS